MLQKSWKKELNSLDKKLSNIQKQNLKNSKAIEKIKTKIERTDIEAKRTLLKDDLLVLEQKRAEIEASLQGVELEIANLKHDKLKIEGRRITSELINRLAYMNLKWERSRQIEILDIYKN